MLKVDLGCGMRKECGWFGIDVRQFKCVDKVMNCGKELLPFEDNSVDEIKSIHLFEHMYPEEFLFCMAECWRVLNPNGFIHIEVPKAGTQAFYIHPDHKLHFTQDTFGFFLVPDNKGHVDIHGYLDGFWHMEIVDQPNPENVSVNLYPNKPKNKRFPYVEVTKYEDA